MRPVTLIDLETAVRVLLAEPRHARAAVARRLIAAADDGDAHRRQTGRSHPRFGCGTLTSAAFQRALAARPAAYDSDALDALGHVVRALAAKHPEGPD